MIQRLYLIVIVCCLSLCASAQKGWELGGWLGVSNYFGDLNSSLNITDPGPAGGLNLRYNFNNRVSWKANFNYGYVYADDANSSNNFERNRNLSFKSNLFDVSAVVEFNFFPLTHGSSDEYATPYFFGGVNLLKFNPKADLNDQTYNLNEFGTEGQRDPYSTITFGLTVGAGYKFDINKDWSINIDLAVRRLFSDYLDDVSTVYPNKTLLAATNGQTAVDLSDRSLVDGIGDEGRQRGNSTDSDMYTFFGVSVMRYFGRLECPKISDIK